VTIGENTRLKGDDVAFAMRDEWKEEPVSTTGAEYVEPSATELIKPGQRVSHLFPRAVMEEYVLQRVTERVWWVTRQFYGSLFYVGKRGVLLFDSPLGAAAGDRIGAHRHLDVAVPVGPPPPGRRPRLAVGRGRREAILGWRGPVPDREHP
jgi:hypothetical protein